jgi:trk system potassium uptake protein TrkA
MRGTKVAVIGVGKYGSAMARKLAEKGAEVFCFDLSIEKIENIKDEVALAVALDATDKKALMAQNIIQVDTAIVAIGDNFEAVILATVNLLELNVKRVIARASGEHQKKILTKLGVEELLTPEEEIANIVAERLLTPGVVSLLELPDNYEIAEVETPKAIANRTLQDIGLRDKYQLTLVTLKRESLVERDGVIVREQHLFGVPTSETVIEETDTLVVFGTVKAVARFLEIND